MKLQHNSETAHRLPHLPGKCTSLHGHSWQIQVTASFPALRRSIGAEFGAFKAGLRGWVDTNLDHGTMLGAGDPLVPVLARAQAFDLRLAAGARKRCNGACCA